MVARYPQQTDPTVIPSALEKTFDELRRRQEAVCGTVDRYPQQTDPTVIPSALEKTFDELRRRHEAVCGMVDRCQASFPHNFPVLYAFGVTTLCFLIYVLAGGSSGGGSGEGSGEGRRVEGSGEGSGEGRRVEASGGDLPVTCTALAIVTQNIAIGTLIACALHDSVSMFYLKKRYSTVDASPSAL